MQRYCRNIEDLPAEVGELAISYVPPRDLCSVMLVSSKMRTLASNPKLWTTMNVKMAKISQKGVSKLFSINRFSKIRKLILNLPQVTNEKLVRNMNAIQSSSVEELKLWRVNFKETPSDILAQTAQCLRSLTLSSCHITSDQCIALLESCSSEPSRVQLELIFVTINDNDLMDKVPVELLGSATRNHQAVTYDGYTMSTEQCRAVLEACIASSNLVELSLIDTYLDGVPPLLLGRAAGHLKKLSLGGNDRCIDTEQCKAVLEACVAAPTLVDLTLKGADLEEVTIELMKKAAEHLHSFDLYISEVTTEQLVAVLETCIAVPTLVKLNLAWLDLREVSVPEVGRYPKPLMLLASIEGEVPPLKQTNKQTNTCLKEQLVILVK